MIKAIKLDPIHGRLSQTFKPGEGPLHPFSKLLLSLASYPQPYHT